MKKQELPELKINNVFTRTNCAKTGESFKASEIIFETNGELINPIEAINYPVMISGKTLSELEEMISFMIESGYQIMQQQKEELKEKNTLPF